jgi:hypothetical protein
LPVLAALSLALRAAAARAAATDQNLQRLQRVTTPGRALVQDHAEDDDQHGHAEQHGDQRHRGLTKMSIAFLSEQHAETCSKP